MKNLNQDVYQVISGERRLRASKMAGLKKVPAFIVSDEREANLISIIDNIQRENLHPLEFAKSCQLLPDNKACSSKQEVANAIGVSKSKVVEALGLLKIPEKLRSKIIEKNITSRSILRKLMKVPNEQDGLDILSNINNPTKNLKKYVKIFTIPFTGGSVNLKIQDTETITKDGLEQLLQKIKEEILEAVAAATS